MLQNVLFIFTRYYHPLHIDKYPVFVNSQGNLLLLFGDYAH